MGVLGSKNGFFFSTPQASILVRGVKWYEFTDFNYQVPLLELTVSEAVLRAERRGCTPTGIRIIFLELQDLEFPFRAFFSKITSSTISCVLFRKSPIQFAIFGGFTQQKMRKSQIWRIVFINLNHFLSSWEIMLSFELRWFWRAKISIFLKRYPTLGDISRFGPGNPQFPFRLFCFSTKSRIPQVTPRICFGEGVIP